MSDTGRYGGTQGIPLGRLNKGIVRNVPPQETPAGAFFDLRGMTAVSRGLRRRSSTEDYVRGATLPENAVAMEAVSIPGSTGMNRYVVTDSWVYAVLPTSFTRFDRKYEVGKVTATISTNTLAWSSGTHMTWIANFIKTGDSVTVDPLGTPETKTIISVGGEESLTVDSVWTATHTDKTYVIKRKVGVAEPYLVDITRLTERIIFTSRANEPWMITSTPGTEIVPAVATYPATGKFKAACCCFWNERMWYGNLIDGTDGERPARLRWSDALDITDLSDPLAFLDLDYTSSPMLRLVPLGSLLVAFFQDAIYIGRPTNIPDLPVSFDTKLDTGGVGLAAQLAVTKFLDGIAFLGQDNVYYLTNSGFGPLAKPVVEQMVTSKMKLWRSQATTDLLESRLLFGITQDTGVMTELWSYDLETKAWSMDTIQSYMLTSVWYTQVEDWASMTLYWDAYTRDWSAFTAQDSRRYVVLEQLGALRKIGAGSGLIDIDGSSVTAMFETGDLTFGFPDVDKALSRISVEISELFGGLRAVPIVFDLFVSVDGAETWMPKETLTIKVGKKEGYANLRAKSSRLRVRLVSSSQVPSYVIEGITVRVKAGGQELSLRLQDVP